MNPNPFKKTQSQNPPPLRVQSVAPRLSEGDRFDYSLMRQASAPAAAHGSPQVKRYPGDPGLPEAMRELFTVMAELACLGVEDPENRRPWLQARIIALQVRIQRG